MSRGLESQKIEFQNNRHEHPTITAETGIEILDQAEKRVLDGIRAQLEGHPQETAALKASIEKGSGLTPEQIEQVASQMNLEGKLKGHESRLHKLGKGVMISLLGLLTISGTLNKPTSAMAAEQTGKTENDPEKGKLKFESSKVDLAQVEQELARIIKEVEPDKSMQQTQIVNEFLAAMKEMNPKLKEQQEWVSSLSGIASLRELSQEIREEKLSSFESLMKKVNGLPPSAYDEVLDQMAQALKIDRKYMDLFFSAVSLSLKHTSPSRPKRLTETIDDLNDLGARQRIDIIDKKF